jgi:hypothetical protein
VFVGPTLAPGDAAGVLEATYLPPAKQGDVCRAVSLFEPRAIGIIDGYFQWAPSVWHKEILWAIAHGVHVFGAASMGALRAAELAPFGMRGVGRIFDAYRDGVLAQSGDEPFEDDDEVAVIHGPAESGYLAASEAMINIRCTLSNADSAGVISGATRARLVAIAKSLYFPERSYDLLLEMARAETLPEVQLAALQAWLPEGRVNQKRADALAMLDTMREFLAGDPAPARAGFFFEHTTLWDRVLAGLQPTALHEAEERSVLEELRLDATRSDELRQQALQSLMPPLPEDVAIDHALLCRLLADRRAQPDEVARLLAEAARVQAARRAREEVPSLFVERQMLAGLRETEEFARLRARAEDKRSRIAARRDLPDVEEFSDLQLLELRDWYFLQALGRDMPDDIEKCVRAWGYSDLAQFHRTIFAEYVYRQMAGSGAAAGATGAVNLAKVVR